MSEFLNIALNAVKKAAEITLKYYESNLKIELKEDKTPVTVADKEAEQIIIESIQKTFPLHSFYGEETGHTNNDSEFLWIIDPIDGTKNYIGGIPLWGTLIALQQNNEIILGVSHIPLLDELLYAEKNHGAFLNYKQVHVSKVDRIEDAMLSFGSLKPFIDNQYDKGIFSLINDTKRQRSFGDLYPYHLLSSGKLEIVCEASIKIVDVAPFSIIIKEAGGITSDFKGNKINLNVDTFIACNNLLHKDIIEKFSAKNS